MYTLLLIKYSEHIFQINGNIFRKIFVLILAHCYPTTTMLIRNILKMKKKSNLDIFNSLNPTNFFMKKIKVFISKTFFET